MKKYDNYKPSGFEWLGEIPAHWEVKRVKDVAFYQSGEYINALDFEEENLYPVYGGNGLRGYADKYNTNGNYVLIGRQGALCGNINYANGKFWATEHCVVVYNKKNIVVKWLGELLTVMNLNQYSQSTAQPGLSVDKIKRLELPVPPLPEQTAIATYLDHKTQAIDKKIVLLTQKAAYYKELRKALINRAVTEGIAENVEMKDSGVEWIGKIPKHWEVRRLKEVANIQTGNTPPMSDKDNYSEMGVPWVKPNDLNEFIPITMTTDYISDKGLEMIRLIKKDSVLVCCIGSIGKMGIAGKDLCTNQQINAIMFNKKINPLFGKYLIYASQNEHLRVSTGNVVAILNSESQKRIKFAYPQTLQEQIAIATYLDEKISVIDAIVANIEKQVATLKELSKTLINEVVTGKVKIN